MASLLDTVVENHRQWQTDARMTTPANDQFAQRWVDAIRKGVFRFYGHQEVQTGIRNIDWTGAHVQHQEWPAQLNRFFWLQALAKIYGETGDEELPQIARSTIEDWIDQHAYSADKPPAEGDNTLNISIRSGQSTKPGWWGTVAQFAGSSHYDDPLFERMIDSSRGQMACLANHLTRKGNWRISHLDCLLFCGLIVPGLDDHVPFAAHWQFPAGPHVLDAANRRAWTQGEPGDVLVQNLMGPSDLAYRIYEGETDPLRGWLPDAKRNHHPAPLFAIEGKTGHTTTLSTLLLPFSGNTPPEFEVDLLQGEATTGVRITWANGDEDLIACAPGLHHQIDQCGPIDSAIASIIGIPLGFPMLAGLWLKKLWKGSYFLIIASCLLPSAYAFYDTNVNGITWTIQDRAMWIFIFGCVSTAISALLSKRNDAQYVKREAEFFKTMAQPIDFAKEIGIDFDRRQLTAMGNAALILGGLLGLIVLVPNPLSGRLLSAGVAGTIIAVGFILKHRGKPIAEV